MAWDRHKHVAVLNRLLRSLLSTLGTEDLLINYNNWRHGLGQTQICGGVKQIIEIPTLSTLGTEDVLIMSPVIIIN
jgi:hypothetical protein